MSMVHDDARPDPIERQVLRQVLLELPEVAQPLADAVAEAATAGAVCVLTSVHGGSLRIIAGQDPSAIAFTEEQLNTGPAIHALRTGAPVLVVAGQPEFEDYQRSAMEHGLLSTMSLPLPTDRYGPGAVLIAYRRQPDGFDDRLRHTLHMLADRVAGVLEMVHRLTTAEPTRLMADRNRLDTAIGMLMARYSCDSEQALERLQSVATDAGLNLNEAAKMVLAQQGH